MNNKQEIIPTQSSNKNLILLLPWLVGFLGVCISLYAAWALHSVTEAEANARFNDISSRVSGEIKRRFNTPVYGLKGIRGIFASGKVVERKELRAWIVSRQIDKEFSGVRGFGFIKRVARRDLPAFEITERADNGEGFFVRTSGTAEDCYVITTIEPLENNRLAWGYDVGQEALRRMAVERAIVSGEPTLTRSIVLVQDGRKGPGYLLFLPVYTKDAKLETPEQRKASLVGLVYTPIIVSELFEDLTLTAESKLDCEVFDDASLRFEDCIYDADGHLADATKVEYRGRRFVADFPIDVGGRQIFLRTSTNEVFESAIDHRSEWLVGIGGVLVSILSSLLAFQLGRGRRRALALASSMTRDLALAKVRTETALRESQTFSETIKSQFIVSVADPSGTIIEVNDAFCEISGYNRDELLGKNHRIINSGYHARTFWNEMWKQIISGKSWRGEVCNRRKDGSLYWVNSVITSFADANGRIERIISVRTDITYRKNSESELKDAATRLTLATKAGGVGVWDWDCVNNLLIWDEQTYALYGKSRKDFGGTYESWLNGLHPDDIAKSESEIAMALSGEKPFNTEFRVVLPDGSIHIIRSLAEVIRDADGKPLRMIGTNWNITEQKNTEQTLMTERLRLAGIIEGTNVGTWEWNVQTGETVFNERWASIIGYTLDEIRPISIDTWVKFAHPDDLKGSNEQLQAHFNGEQPYYDFEARMKHKNGEWVWVLDRGKVVSWTKDGKPLMMLGTHQDITQRKRAEQKLLETNHELAKTSEEAKKMAERAEMANIAKSEFLANMSHEIRTPMNSVIGMTGLLLDTNLSDEQRRYAETVKSSGESLLLLINDILDFSKIEAGKLDLEALNFDLQILLDDFVSTMAFKAQNNGLELICAADPNVPLLLTGDSSRLRQILTNLVGNAMKFTHQGEVVVKVSIADSGAISSANDSCLLRFSVRDTGIGIPKDKIGLLFQQFNQVDASTTRKYGGTGLGLAISKQLAELMGGAIGVESIEGKGSEFWFTVRFNKQAEVNHAALSVPANLKGVRVLIIDDNATNREILSVRTTSWGMRPVEAQDGHSGLQVLSQAINEGDPFRLAIIDMQMPGTDGETVGRKIRADAKFAALRLVMLTSMSIHGNVTPILNRVKEIGFDAYATKPVSHEKLKSILSHLLASGTDNSPQSIVTPQIVHEQFPTFHGNKSRILLADDNIINQKVALSILKKLGLSAEAVSNGKEVIESLKSLPFDLVLMDVQMPVMDGLEATRLIRDPKSAIANRNIPIIAMTANAMQGDKEMCLESGMNDYVSKPISIKALADVLEIWLPKE